LLLFVPLKVFFYLNDASTGSEPMGISLFFIAIAVCTLLFGVVFLVKVKFFDLRNQNKHQLPILCFFSYSEDHRINICKLGTKNVNTDLLKKLLFPGLSFYVSILLSVICTLFQIYLNYVTGTFFLLSFITIIFFNSLCICSKGAFFEKIKQKPNFLNEMSFTLFFLSNLILIFSHYFLLTTHEDLSGVVLSFLVLRLSANTLKTLLNSMAQTRTILF